MAFLIFVNSKDDVIHQFYHAGKSFISQRAFLALMICINMFIQTTVRGEVSLTHYTVRVNYLFPVLHYFDDVFLYQGRTKFSDKFVNYLDVTG